MTQRLHLTLESELNALHQVSEAVERFGLEQEWAADLLFQIQLALEELASNVINHGYGEPGHEFEIVIDSSPSSLTIEITDSARAFDPLSDAPDAQLDAELEDRRIGGLGVYFVRTMMDEMHYERDGGKNRLTLVKKREPSEA